MTRLVKTRAIVLRHAPHSETSRIIQWLTPSHGRITTIAKGAMRPRNPMLGQFDLGYTCELVFYGRERDTVLVTREVAPLRLRTRYRTDWRSAVAAQLVTDLAGRVAGRHEPSRELFALTEETLDELDRHGWRPPLLFLFELRLLDALGLSPRLDHCTACGCVLDPGSGAFYARQRGGLLCPSCGKGEAGSMRIGADVQAILSLWQRTEGWAVARNARCTASQAKSIGNLLGDFITYHLDIPSTARDAALDMLC